MNTQNNLSKILGKIREIAEKSSNEPKHYKKVPISTAANLNTIKKCPQLSTVNTKRTLRRNTLI